jgi:hypothetical protein
LGPGSGSHLFEPRLARLRLGVFEPVDIISCNQLFPCAYDCFVKPTESIAAEPELFKSQSKPTFDLQIVFYTFQCAAHCVNNRPIIDWSTFAQAMYSVSGNCVCRKIFGQERANVAVKRS